MRETATSTGGMTPQERRGAFALAGIFILRMLGLFMVLPVLVLYERHLAGVTPTLLGIALGAYGLTQALLQIPFGMLSDRIGRKPVIIGGLLLFALGSVIAAAADHILWMILGRAIQGSGAIAAAIMALAADLTREEQRTKVMAIIGMSIGMSFAMAMVLGPLLGAWVGVHGIFWITAGLALCGIVILQLGVPSAPDRVHRDADVVPTQLASVIRDGQLLRLDLGILALHFIMTATFIAVPVALRDQAGLATAHHWLLYLPVLVLSVIVMVPFIIIAERRRKMKQVFLGAVLVVALSQGLLAMFHASALAIGAALLAYFSAFNLLEATLPSLISKIAPADRKGTALGVYSSSQFLGAFLGGACGGWVSGWAGLTGVFATAAGVALVWLAYASTMRSPRYLSSYTVQVGPVEAPAAEQIKRRLLQVAGVAEAEVVAEDGVAYLKVDRHALDQDALREFSVSNA